jgi:hypothetical protein
MSYKNTSLQKAVVEEIKEVELDVVEKEGNAVIVIIDGWRMRIYFEGDYFLSSNKVLAKYTGDLSDVHSIKFHKLN